MKLKFIFIVFFFIFMEYVVAQNRDSISFLSLKVRKIEFSEQNQTYFIYAKSYKLKKNFLILSPINRNNQFPDKLKPIKRGKTYLLKIEYLNKTHVILGSSAIHNVFGNKIIVKEEITWYGEIVIAHNLYGRYYELILE